MFVREQAVAEAHNLLLAGSARRPSKQLRHTRLCVEILKDLCGDLTCSRA